MNKEDLKYEINREVGAQDAWEQFGEIPVNEWFWEYNTRVIDGGLPCFKHHNDIHLRYRMIGKHLFLWEW